MLNSSLNQEINFSSQQIDIKELNAFMNQKRKKAEKEASKYDVDRETQAKALNVQHLASMPKYLPLFTKKIKDPKSIKNSVAAKDLDYSKNQNQKYQQSNKDVEQLN